MDKELEIAQFIERCGQHRGKRINNSSLHAGSPMYYYCRHCDAPTETLPELHRQRPITVCVPCNVLVEHGLLAEVERQARSRLETAVPVENP